MSSQHPDFKWIEQLHFGNEEAYRILFDEYYQMLGVFAMKYVKDKEVAEDIVQDVITELYSRRLLFDTPVALKSFLFLSVKNKGVFPSDTALEKLVYLAYRNIRKKWTMPLANWATISQQLAIKFGERFKLL